MATIRDVARLSGVSVTTVSVVLNNAPRPVNSDTRQRVIAAARRLNYHPNAIARSLVSRRTNSLGVQFSSVEPAVVTNYYAAGVLSGILTESAAHKNDVHLFTSPWENATVSGPRVKAQRTDGVLAVAPVIGSDIASGLEDIGLPVVVISAPSGTPDVPYVDVDNVAGGRLVVEHLLTLGHRKIAFLAGERNMFSEIERMDAFRATMRDAGLTVPEHYVFGNTYQEECVEQDVARLLSLPDRPTAIFACNDNLAMLVFKAASRLGIRIPEQLSLVGYDDAPLANLITSALTTVRHPLCDVGIMATRILMDRIEGRPVPEKYLFSPELIVRATTRPPYVP